MSATPFVVIPTRSTMLSLTESAAVQWVLLVIVLFALFLLYEQVAFRWRKSSLPGPTWVTYVRLLSKCAPELLSGRSLAVW